MDPPISPLHLPRPTRKWQWNYRNSFASRFNTTSNKELIQITRPEAFKCMTFNATEGNSLVTGDFEGGIKLWDLERSKSVLSIKGHDQIINAMDGCGGQSVTSGPPELVTASRDGFVKVTVSVI